MAVIQIVSGKAAEAKKKQIHFTGNHILSTESMAYMREKWVPRLHQVIKDAKEGQVYFEKQKNALALKNR